MRKYLTAYLAYIDNIISSGQEYDEEKLKEEHLKQIQFMQHERLIHLIVTVLFAVLLFISLGILVSTGEFAFLILTLMLLLLLIPYIFHYYFLENSVQKMYRQFSSMKHSSDIPGICRHGVSKK